MGKPTGFLEYKRETAKVLPPKVRIANFKEFRTPLNKEKQKLQGALEGLGRLVAEGKIPAEPIPAFQVEVPADKSHGDFAANVAMVSAKTFRMAPRKIAELLLDAVSLDGTIFDRAEIAGPGFNQVDRPSQPNL